MIDITKHRAYIISVDRRVLKMELLTIKQIRVGLNMTQKKWLNILVYLLLATKEKKVELKISTFGKSRRFAPKLLFR